MKEGKQPNRAVAIRGSEERTVNKSIERFLSIACLLLFTQQVTHLISHSAALTSACSSRASPRAGALHIKH